MNVLCYRHEKVDALDKLKQSKLDHVTVNQEYNNQVPKGAIAKKC